MHELCEVADHIEQDVQQTASVFTWAKSVPNSEARLFAMRLALAALNGTETEDEIAGELSGAGLRISVEMG